MYNNYKNKTFSLLGFSLTALLLFLSSTFNNALAQQASEFSLESSTDRCVALRQGQTCYKKITLTWQTTQPANVCLYNSLTSTELQCWQQQTNGELKAEFESDSDINYQLRNQGNETVLAEVTVKVSWVYEPKEEKSTGWRIF